jgi:predicted RND superfamily exporter protein
VGAAALEPVLEQVDRELAEIEMRYPGYHLHLTGTVVVAARSLRGVIRDLAVSLGFDAAVVFLVIALGLRSFTYGLISVIPNALPLLFVANYLLWTGQPLQVVSVLTFCLCLGIAVDDTIHFLMAYRRERGAGREAWSAIRHTVHHCGTAVIMTSIILAGGFAVMMASVMPALRLFGFLTTLTFLVAMVSEILVLPALLTCAETIRPRVGKSSL